MTETTETGFESWAILELMGHRRLGGFVREVQVAGAGFLRIDVPGDSEGETHSTQFYPPSSVYCLTPVTEPMARAVAKSSRPQPVQRWELPEPNRDRTCFGCGESHGGICRACGNRHACPCGDRPTGHNGEDIVAEQDLEDEIAYEHRMAAEASF